MDQKFFCRSHCEPYCSCTFKCCTFKQYNFYV